MRQFRIVIQEFELDWKFDKDAVKQFSVDFMIEECNKRFVEYSIEQNFKSLLETFMDRRCKERFRSIKRGDSNGSMGD